MQRSYFQKVLVKGATGDKRRELSKIKGRLLTAPRRAASIAAGSGCGDLGPPHRRPAGPGRTGLRCLPGVCALWGVPFGVVLSATVRKLGPGRCAEASPSFRSVWLRRHQQRSPMVPAPGSCGSCVTLLSCNVVTCLTLECSAVTCVRRIPSPVSPLCLHVHTHNV